MSFLEFIKKHRKLILIILAIIFIIGVIISFKLIAFVIRKNTECLNNPFVYDAQRLYEEGGLEVNCICYPLDISFSSFSFNRYNITIGGEMYPIIGLNRSS